MPGAIHQLGGEQYEVLLRLVTYGETHGATGMEILAAVETGIVEDTLHNRDTATPKNPAVGWRQEEPEYGTVAQRLDLNRTIPSFYNQVLALRGKYRTSGELAQAVQRSAFPLRYGEAEPLAKELISELGKNKAHSGVQFGPEPGHGGVFNVTTSERTDPPQHAEKVKESGRKLGAAGSSFTGHAQAMRNLASRHVKF